MIFLGIGMHADRIPDLIPNTLNETSQLTQQMGWVFVASLFLRAYSLGGGTYTGIEAVSNNVQSLAEPRVLTGKWTMFYMAVSLSFIAGGIILLYLLWSVQPVEGETLNAVTFRAILQDAIGNAAIESPTLWLLLTLEGGLLFVAANTGYLGGPAVLANMAANSWVPHQYRYLSSRLVTQRGIVLMGLAAVGILVATGGSVALLVVLYSINVFLTFSLSLLGLCIYWWRVRHTDHRWIVRIALSGLGLAVTSGILAVTTVEKFAEGGFMTVLITGVVIGFCILNRAHYHKIRRKLGKADEALPMEYTSLTAPPVMESNEATAVFVVGSNRWGGVYALDWVRREFPGHFHNFVFMSARTVDAKCYSGSEELEQERKKAEETLSYFVTYCNNRSLAARTYVWIRHRPDRRADKSRRKNSARFSAQYVLHQQADLRTRQLVHSTTSQRGGSHIAAPPSPVGHANGRTSHETLATKVTPHEQQGREDILVVTTAIALQPLEECHVRPCSPA